MHAKQRLDSTQDIANKFHVSFKHTRTVIKAIDCLCETKAINHIKTCMELPMAYMNSAKNWSNKYTDQCYNLYPLRRHTVY